jgi:hypothetical protein
MQGGLIFFAIQVNHLPRWTDFESWQSVHISEVGYVVKVEFTVNVLGC